MEVLMVVLIAAGFVWLTSSCLNLIAMMWFAYKNIDVIEQHLSDCEGITATSNLWQGGVIGRHMRLSIIFATMYMPGVMYRRGDITKDAHLNIPFQLRRKIWAIYIWLFINAGFLAVLCYAVETPR